ncbi:glycine-rich RNA-binding protein 7-like [Quercus suber]|uniref:glycine-rich RNA-binding protein 7-like n=1 Tax=Quercus suber TaxID=58331 RepID=UPI0032DE4487
MHLNQNSDGGDGWDSDDDVVNKWSKWVLRMSNYPVFKPVLKAENIRFEKICFLTHLSNSNAITEYAVHGGWGIIKKNDKKRVRAIAKKVANGDQKIPEKHEASSGGDRDGGGRGDGDGGGGDEDGGGGGDGEGGGGDFGGGGGGGGDGDGDGGSGEDGEGGNGDFSGGDEIDGGEDGEGGGGGRFFGSGGEGDGGCSGNFGRGSGNLSGGGLLKTSGGCDV